MAALLWNVGEGYDIHVLRTPANAPAIPARPLDKSFKTQFPLSFIPHFKGAPNAQGVKVNLTTGVVTAGPSPNPVDKLRNFLMTARQVDGQDIYETIIRIHLHEGIQKIWLTPSPLTVRRHAQECRFTVLALFDDDTVGDITDWPQLTYSSQLPAAVSVLNAGDHFGGAEGEPEVIGGRLTARPGDFDDAIEITVELPSSLNVAPASAKVVPTKSWSDLAEDPNTKVTWVAGPLRPQDGNPARPNHVISVVKSWPNILFVSEGFRAKQQSSPIDPEKDFQRAVQKIVDEWQGNTALEPFNLLKGSINYWSLFWPSREDGISLLGDYETSGSLGLRVPLPEEPAPGSTQWSVENMIHQLGLPVPKDPPQSISDAVTRWNKLYATQVTAAQLEKLVKNSFSDWNDLRSRSPLNERDTAFGFAIHTRTRASRAAEGDPLLRPALRRTSEADVDEFTRNLKISGFPIGDPWGGNGKDRGLVCFVCLSDRGAGEARPGYFAASTGYEFRASTVPAANGNGRDIKTALLSDKKGPYNPFLLAERAVHECGHAFGMADEYGPGTGATLTSAPPNVPNLQAKNVITSTSGGYDPNKIKWLFPRAIKVGRMSKKKPDPISGNDFQMNLDKGHGKFFAKGDLVLIRRPPIGSDPFADLRFEVRDQPHADWLVARQKTGPTFDPANDYDPTQLHVLICCSKSPGVELKLIADKVLKRIAQKGPLTAAICNAAKNANPVMTPIDMPNLNYKAAPPSPADIIGIYEGGGHFDCGIFRPAGRCKMRTSDDFFVPQNQIIPFCQVCRYLIVDRVDAMKLKKLDDLYDPNYPT